LGISTIKSGQSIRLDSGLNIALETKGTSGSIYFTAKGQLLLQSNSFVVDVDATNQHGIYARFA
jgi:hypothetical protein